MNLPNSIFADFIKNYDVFDEQKRSKKFRLSMVRTLQGLGLPTPVYGKKAPFGYVKVDRCFMPIESDLQILHKAIELSDSPDYYFHDAVTWISEVSSKRVSPRAFTDIKRERPTFPEIILPIQERIKLVYNGTTPASSEEIL